MLRWDKKKVQDLVDVGADPDLDGGRVVGGALVRELRVTTARQLARSLGREYILSHLQKVSIFTTSVYVYHYDYQLYRLLH